MSDHTPIYEVQAGHLRLFDPELALDFFDEIPLGKSVAACEAGVAGDAMLVSGPLTKTVMRSGIADGEECRFRASGELLGSSFFRQGLLHGPSRWFFVDGTLSAITWFIEGRPCGRATFFHPNGAVARQLRYLDGCPHGPHAFYTAEGTKQADLPYTNGLLDGTVRLFSADGVLVREATFANGKRHGLDTLWSATTGDILFALKYADGMLVASPVVDEVISRHKSIQ